MSNCFDLLRILTVKSIFRLRKILLLVLLSASQILCAQLQVNYYKVEDGAFIQAESLKKGDSLELVKLNKRVVQRWSDKGYIMVSIDSMIVNSDKSVSIYLYVGPLLKTLRIEVEDAETREVLKNMSGVNEKILSRTPFLNDQISQVRRKILVHLENNGYPFAQLSFESLQFGEIPSVRLKIRKGSYVSWKKININGDLKLSRNVIMTLIEIKVGDAYSEEKFQKVAQKLTQIGFLTLSQAPQVAFYPDGVELFLYLSKRESSSANGILGMQPNQAGKIIFTGDIQLNLENVLSVGERFNLVWKNLLPQTPQLNVGLNLPFLYKTRFGVEGKFHLYKRDTSFLEVKGNLGVRYFLGGNNFIRGFYSFENSSLLNGASNNPLFSDGVSVKINGYGIGFERQMLDYFPNPRSGMKLEFQSVFGSRTTLPLDENNFTTAGSKSNVFRLNFQLDYFIPIGQRSTVRLGGLAQFYYADTIFTNEQIRFGGLQTLRGFDEESILATSMARVSIEFRFLLDQNSHLLVFFDQAMYENRTRSYYRDTPFGFGAGMSFGTKVGMFSIMYGLGSQFGNPIRVRDGKIHVGYLAVF